MRPIILNAGILIATAAIALPFQLPIHASPHSFASSQAQREKAGKKVLVQVNGGCETDIYLVYEDAERGLSNLTLTARGTSINLRLHPNAKIWSASYAGSHDPDYLIYTVSKQEEQEIFLCKR
jgi:hypothetical protein